MRYLRNLMILTVQTPEVAASTGNGEARGARMEVVQWFLLNGVNGQRTGLAIDFAHKHTVLIATAPTDTRLAIGNLAKMRTELTLHPSIIQLPIVFTLHQNTIASYTYNSASRQPSQPMPALSCEQWPTNSSFVQFTSSATCGRNVPLRYPFLI